MSEVALSPEPSELLVAIETVRALLDAGDVQRAMKIAVVSYDKAKAEADCAEKVKASRELIDKARRMQAEAAKIEGICYVAMADAVDAAQASGKLSRGRPEKVLAEDHFTLEDVGVDKRRLHEARQLRDAVRAEPEFIDRIVEARLSEGLEPSRAALKKAAGHAIGTKTASKDEKGDQLYETPNEATRTVLALESFSEIIKEPFVGKAAILRPLEAAGYDVLIADLVDRGIATQHGELQQVGDFLLSDPGETVGTDIFTNPPYGDLANKCLAHALRVHKPGKMAALLNLNFMCGFDDPDRRYVMDENPPSRVYVFTRRLPMMHRNGWEGNVASSQMNTGFFVWERNDDGSYGSCDGTWKTIRVDWKAFEHAEPLAPGDGGHRAPMVFTEAEEDFSRSTPRKTVDERVGEELARALVWMAEQDEFTVATLRQGIAVRPLVAAALIDECSGRRLIEGDGAYRITASGMTALEATLAVVLGANLPESEAA